MTRRIDGGPATPVRLRRAGFVLEREHADLDADTYHDFVNIGEYRGYPARVYRDWLGRFRPYPSTAWLVLHCNNPSCEAVALRRARAIEAEVNHAFLAWHPDYRERMRAS